MPPQFGQAGASSWFWNAPSSPSPVGREDRLDRPAQVRRRAADGGLGRREQVGLDLVGGRAVAVGLSRHGRR